MPVGWCDWVPRNRNPVFFLGWFFRKHGLENVHILSINIRAKTDKKSFSKSQVVLMATYRGNEPMAALIKEKDTCSNALVDLWCVIDFMEKVGFEKKTMAEKVRKMVRKLGMAQIAQKGCLEGFILLLFLGCWATAKLTIGFQPWPKFTSSVAKKVSFPLSTIFRSELEEMPLPFLLGQGFCVNHLIKFLLWPGYTPLLFPQKP